MTIHITEKHIRMGKKNSPKSCPTALAVREALNSDIPIDVTHIAVWIGNDRYGLPSIAVNFINKFDEGRKVEPIEFKIDITP